jgi:hypothetical protein
MALLESKQIEAIRIPQISLIDVRSGSDYHVVGDLTIIAVICNHCPYVLHIKSVMQEVLNSALTKGFEVVAISGNDVRHYPEDAPDKMKLFSDGFEFPYLYDEKQLFLKALQAVCTPEFYIFRKQVLVYHGRFDSASPGNSVVVTGCDLKQAIIDILHNKQISLQLPSIGCSIKWCR